MRTHQDRSENVRRYGSRRQVIGPEFLETNPAGQLHSTIATLFPHHHLIITSPPLHALQREVFKDWLNGQETSAFGEAPTTQSLTWAAAESVDLILAPGGVVVIRPELERLDLAFAADEQLQSYWGVPVHRIRFMSVQNKRVRQALRERGELWRINTRAVKKEEAKELIEHSRVAINCQTIYYYNPQSGTRFLTCAEFARLADLNDSALARQLGEISEHCVKRNRHGNPEVAFFGVDNLLFGGPNFAKLEWQSIPSAELRERHAAIAQEFREATPANLRIDNPDHLEWQQQMLAAISSASNSPGGILDPCSEEVLPTIRWLPGGFFHDGEFHLAPITEPKPGEPKDAELEAIWDPLSRGFITNFIREHSKIEYLNLGRIEDGTHGGNGRRGVYLAEIKVRGEAPHKLLFLRVLRWGIRERLHEKDEHGRPKDFVRAVLDTEEFIDYVQDRRLACVQLGMHLPEQVQMRRVSERYNGWRSEFVGQYLPVIYFERDFIKGTATNLVSERKLSESRYALRLATLLGKAAVPNIIVGRSTDPKRGETIGVPVFDDGHEIILEGSDGLPREIVVTDATETFASWQSPTLIPFAKAYAAPVNTRAAQVPHPKEFARTYLQAFADEFRRLQSEYDRKQKAFDGLFKHLPVREGSFASRWSSVLDRLAKTNIDALVNAIRHDITVLSTAETAAPFPGEAYQI
jgi:hypothetical protein